MRKLTLRYGLALGALAGLSLARAQTPAASEIALVLEQHKFTPEEFESKELRVEKIVPGNKTLKVRMGALKPGTYKFVGEYHEATAKGRIVAE